jgi:hypothetical protein
VALPDDELDVHFVRNYRREELDHITKVVEEASKAAQGSRGQAKYEAVINTCRGRNSELLDVVIGALSAVSRAEAKRNYEAVINTCRGQNSDLLDVAIGALSAVSRADSS